MKREGRGRRREQTGRGVSKEGEEEKGVGEDGTLREER